MDCIFIFLGYFHDAPPCFMATLFFNRSPACGILLLFYQNRVSGRCRRSFGRGVAGASGRAYFPRIVCRGRWGRSGLFLRSGVSRCRMSGVFSVTLPSRSAYRTFIGLCRKMRTDGAFVIKSDSSLSVGRPLPRGGKHTGPPCKERP